MHHRRLGRNSLRHRNREGLTLGLVSVGLVASVLIYDQFFEDNSEREATTSPSSGGLPEALPRGETMPAIDNLGMIALRDVVSPEPFIISINGVDYAWPVGRPRRSFYKIALPCDPLNMANAATRCHGSPNDSGDGIGDNYAMDFVYRDPSSGNGQVDAIVGEPIYAFTDGIVEGINPGSDNPSCAQLHLRSSVDNRDYWYGHLDGEVVVSDGQQVEAGQVLGKVGGSECANSGIAHLHHEGSYPGMTAGPDENRDPKYIDLLQSIYYGLPE